MKSINPWRYAKPSIRFRHLRCYSADGEVRPTGGVTLAYQVDFKAKTIEVAWAMCNEVDHYNKSVGRNIASTRLMDVVPKYHEAYQLKAEDEQRLYEINEVLDQVNEHIMAEWMQRRGMSEMEESAE